jgi:ankyrin repeat protein
VNTLTKNKERNTALHLSSMSGYTHVVKLLLQMGAEIYAEDETNKYTAMHYAAQWNRVNCLIELWKGGGNIQIYADSEDGESLIITATKYDAVDVVDWLLDTTFFLNAQGNRKQTLLHYAACNDSRNVAWLLVNRGADVNCRDDALRTPLVCAVQRRNYEIASQLLSGTADPCTEDIDKMNAFHYAAMVGEVRFFKLLLPRYTLAPSVDKYGDSPLHLAAAYGHVKLAKWLLNNGWMVDICNKMGSTPLINASWGGHYNVAEMLLNRNADVNATVMNGDNRSVLHSASFSGNAELVDMLLQKGAIANARTNTDRRTPLHWAIHEGYLQIVRVLVEYGADTTAQDAQGLSAMDIAYSKGHVGIISFLKSLDK